VLRSWQANLNPGAVDDYDAECDVLSPDRIEFLTRAVILVAGRCRRRVASSTTPSEKTSSTPASAARAARWRHIPIWSAVLRRLKRRRFSSP
jgi:hypothetical protein